MGPFTCGVCLSLPCGCKELSTPSDTSRAPAFSPQTALLRDITELAKLPAGPALFTRRLSELPPIEDTAVLDQYPDCQPRTPIDPPSTVRSPGLMRGNADLQPATWNPPAWVKPIIGGEQ